MPGAGAGGAPRLDPAGDAPGTVDPTAMGGCEVGGDGAGPRGDSGAARAGNRAPLLTVVVGLRVGSVVGSVGVAGAGSWAPAAVAGIATA